jgi:DUF4097 and DUF4098 domain-containing protein YvlB
MPQFRKPSVIGSISLGALMIFALACAASAQYTEEFHRTVPISANGRVSLENINGNVTITGWDRNEVQIDAVKKANEQQKLAEARIEVDANSDSVHIRTKYPDRHNNNNPATVTYQLHVPRAARLEDVDLVNGSLDISGVSGDLKANLVNGKATIEDLSSRAEISTVNGAIHVDFRSLDSAKDIRLKSVNGSITLGLPPSPNAELSVSTVNGGITTDFPLQVQGKFMGRHLDGKLGNGGTRIEISNVNGSVKIGNAKSSL